MQRGSSGGMGLMEGLEYTRPETRERKPQIEAYLKLIDASIARRKKEGIEGDGHPDRISNDSPYAALFDPAHRADPRFASRFMWINALAAYFKAAEERGIDLLKLEKPSWLKLAERDEKAWLAKTREQRYIAIETDRATALAKQWKPELDTIPNDAQCLDIGCGSGFFVRHMKKHYPGQHWQATDLARDMPISGSVLDRNKSDWFKECKKGKSLPYETASQDVVTLHNVLHHVGSEAFPAFMKEIERVLKPGGTLLVTEEFAGVQCEVSTGRMRPATSDSQMPRHMDSVFWRNDQGDQRPLHQWQTMIASAARFNMDLDNNHRVVGTFGTPGLPIMEACMKFTRVGEDEWWHHGGGPYL